MIPGLRLPSKGPGPRISWNSLRPHAQSLRPVDEVVRITEMPAARVQRWYLVVGGLLGCAALAGAGVVVHHSRPRARTVQSIVSGRAGLRKTSSGAAEHWSSAALTVTIDPSLAGATPAAKEAIMDAFGAWAASGAFLPQLSFDVTSTSGGAAQDGVNRLLLGPIPFAGQEKDLAVTVSYADAESGDVIEADTIFNSAYDWTSMGSVTGKGTGKSSCEGSYDLQNVATHEAGHFFGLGEDYSDDATTMYVSSAPCQTSKRTLSSTDVAVVSGLYAQPLAAPAPKVGCGATIAGRHDDGRSPAMAIAAALALVGLRRRRRA